MEPTINTKQTQDLSPNSVLLKKFGDVVVAQDYFANRGIGLLPVAKRLQSANFIAGSKGWKIDSNGVSEFN